MDSSESDVPRRKRRRQESVGAAVDYDGDGVAAAICNTNMRPGPGAGASRGSCSRCRPRSASRNGMPMQNHIRGRYRGRTRHTEASTCDTCRRRGRVEALAASSSIAPKASLSRMALLLVCLGMLCSSSFGGTAVSVTASSADSPVKPSLNDEGISLQSGEGDEDDILEEMLLSDFDASLDVNGDDIVDQSDRPKIRVQSSGEQEDSQSDAGGVDDSVIILSSVDGTLAGISRTSGRVLWKQSRDQIATPNHTQDGRGKDHSKEVAGAPTEWSKFLSPLVSTSTKSEGHQHARQWQAVPSIDGTVYLTGGDGADASGHELTTTAHIRDLVDRSPFVDPQQRFFVGSRKAMVAAVDERTGEILRVIPKFKREDGEEGEELPPSLEGRDVVWIGRLEHTVTVHDLQKGAVDVEFSVAEILSVDEMLHGEGRGGRQPLSPLGVPKEGDEGDGVGDAVARRQEEELEQLFTEYITEALRHPSSGDRILRLPAPGESEEEGPRAKLGREGSQISQGSPFLVSTPSGNVAFRDDADSSVVGWVSFDLLQSPVVYAIDASSGQKLRVNMLDDAAVSPSGSTKVGLPQLLQKQIASIEQSLLSDGTVDACSEGKPGECRALEAVGFGARGSVVGALQNGQIYALPLGERITRPQSLPLGLPQPHSAASDMVNAKLGLENEPTLNTHHAIGFHRRESLGSDDIDSGDRRPIHLDSAKDNQFCTPASPLYPGCLIGASLMLGNLLDVDGNLDMASVFASSDLDYDLYLDMLEAGTSRKRGNVWQQIVKIMSSWIAPTVAFIFVLSFELGRRTRERRKAEAKARSALLGEDEITAEGFNEARQNSASNGQGGVIQLTDEILGYGGHGTVVYKGVLDKRQVAVKRLLAMYHASADREISLLIESDGHPNVVRYFLKEMRGDFVYLALELCDMSLNDLIVSLGKLRNARKENFELAPGDTDDFESATKSLLFQIASGVRHIHSLRIVHRDLKPQNILLALRSTKPKSLIEEAAKPEDSGSSDSEADTMDDTAHSTCSDTNAILECFKKNEYVPKISDMGLGKQLAGQSSFGLSTLGTGSVGGPGAGDAGAGAGSVGWQAPEVMAQRWSPETSNVNEATSDSPPMEASPLEAGVNNRTSRSVDVFSLGCIFYCTILPGSHPFGEWYEREANIMKNAPNKEDLEFVSPDAGDLILSMISRNAKARPTAEEVCEHPFFWSLAKRLKFLCDLSDRIELCDSQGSDDDDRSSALHIMAIESGAVDIFGTSWEKKLDPELIEASLSRRTYDPSSVRDCLRMIRNKHHHYDELPAKLKSKIGSSTDGLSCYVMRTFPKLLMHCYHFCVTNLSPDDSLSMDYNLPIARHSQSNKDVEKEAALAIGDLSALEEETKLETIPDADDEQEKEEEHRDEDDVCSAAPELEDELRLDHDAQMPEKAPELAPPQDLLSPRAGEEQPQPNLAGIVVWAGSVTAKDLNCRGWCRSDEEWTQRIDAKLRKRDSNLTRCADDPKFRTRLCNHWDVSEGTHCPMRKKGKCIFAHGPVELRVKEGKRHRWGTLVRKDGLCANARASGGEDTYGAAKSIENTRKEQGQWNTKTQKQNKGRKATPKKKKDAAS